GFYHAGQVCVSVQKAFVHEDIVDGFTKKYTQMATKLIIGDPLDPKTEVGPIIDSYELERVENWVNEAKERGAKILCGGKRLSDSTYAPTVVYNPPDDVMLSKDEVFGPVVCIYPFKNREDAITRANSLDVAFQAAVYTKDINAAMDTVNKLNASAVMVNDHTAFRVDWMPFGGRDVSGIGTGGIPYSMHEMTRDKLMVINYG
ncbi:MAG: aldehyde dehydrogenase, partial [Bacteroidetes bacterium 4572_117]